MHDLAEAVLELRMWVEAAIDFPEEEVDFLGDRALDARLEFIRHRFAELAETARQGVIRIRIEPSWIVESMSTPSRFLSSFPPSKSKLI